MKVTNREQFHAEVKRMLRGLDDGQRENLARRVCDEQGYSASAVPRWFDGVSAPHLSLYEGFFEAMREAKEFLKYG